MSFDLVLIEIVDTSKNGDQSFIEELLEDLPTEYQEIKSELSGVLEKLAVDIRLRDMSTRFAASADHQKPDTLLKQVVAQAGTVFSQICHDQIRAYLDYLDLSQKKLRSAFDEWLVAKVRNY